MLKDNFFVASNILGIEWIGKIMDLFTSGPATSVLFILILVCNSQWHSPDKKNLKPAVKEFDWILLKILYETIKFHGLWAAVVIFFRRVLVELLWNSILRNLRYSYTQITRHSHSVDLISPKKTLKTPTLKRYELLLLFCMTIRELWTLAASELLLAGSQVTFYLTWTKSYVANIYLFKFSQLATCTVTILDSDSYIKVLVLTTYKNITVFPFVHWTVGCLLFASCNCATSSRTFLVWAKGFFILEIKHPQDEECYIFI